MFLTLEKNTDPMYVCDIETDGLTPTKIHCLSVGWVKDGKWEIKTTTNYDEMRKMMSKDTYFIFHSGQRFDRPVLERLLGIKIPYERVIDTVGVSWYLYSKRANHNLEDWGVELGTAKPEITDWENLSIEEYIHRCESDVRITIKLWEKMVSDLKQLYGDSIWGICKYLSYKMYCLHIQEKYPTTIDIKKCEENLAKLDLIKEEKLTALKKAMPQEKITRVKHRPKVMHKKDGSLSTLGAKWLTLLDEMKLPHDTQEVEVVADHKEPNPDSPLQIKTWLFSLGWEPKTFNDGKNGKVPQIYITIDQQKYLCPSIKELDSPAIEHLDNLGVLRHRMGLLKGFLRNEVDGKVVAKANGFTSTLRLRHAILVNLPKPSMPWGKEIREVIIAPEGEELCGSDMAGLEDRTKQHYIRPLDPKFVETMLDEDYDPHLTLAVFGGALTQEQSQSHKDGVEDYGDIRHKWKQVNYMSTYGVGAKKLAGYIGVKRSEAKAMIEKYWGLNWAVKAVSYEFRTLDALGKTWILNPVSNFWYELRNEKDRFSAVNQSTGAYAFDVWLMYILRQRECVVYQAHDEILTPVKKGNRDKMEKILRTSIAKTNKALKLNRELDVDVQWGEDYSKVH